MKRLVALCRDSRGAASIEMAIVVPVLTLFLWGIFQVGVVFQANAGMQHALGEGARLATLCYNPTTSGCSTPSNSAIIAKIDEKKFGMKVGTFSTPTVTTPDPTECTECKDLQVSYTITPNFLFFTGKPVSFTRTKRVYMAG